VRASVVPRQRTLVQVSHEQLADVFPYGPEANVQVFQNTNPAKRSTTSAMRPACTVRPPDCASIQHNGPAALSETERAA
jgi:hypothetical protein